MYWGYVIAVQLTAKISSLSIDTYAQLFTFIIGINAANERS